MLKVTGYTTRIDLEHGGYLIVPSPWDRILFPRTFATEKAAQDAIKVLEQATEFGQDFIPVVCNDKTVRIYYIPSNFCPRQFLFPTKFGFRNEFHSVSKAISFIQDNIEQMVF